MKNSAYASEAISVKGARGVWITASDGSKYLDGCAGTFNIGLGYGHPDVAMALSSVISSGFLHGSGTLRTETIERAEAQLVSIAPDNLDRCHLKGSTGGSTAVEQAVRHAWAVTGRRGILSFVGGHHGQTIASTLFSGMEERKQRVATLQLDVALVSPPDCYRCPFGKSVSSCKRECAYAIEEQIESRSLNGDHDIAAMVAEPVLGAGGGIIPPRDYWMIVSGILAKHGIMLIFDEVQTFGRLGTFLASAYYDVGPQFIAVAKSISGIGVPGAGALLLSSDHCVLDSGERSLTWGGSNLVAAAITSTIEVMKSPGFFEHTIDVAINLREKLDSLWQRFGNIGCVRTVGLMSGIEIVDSRESRKASPTLAAQIIDKCRDAGLLLRQSGYGRGGFIKIRPALTISVEEAEEICTRLEWAISAASEE